MLDVEAPQSLSSPGRRSTRQLTLAFNELASTAGASTSPTTKDGGNPHRIQTDWNHFSRSFSQSSHGFLSLETELDPASLVRA